MSNFRSSLESNYKKEIKYMKQFKQLNKNLNNLTEKLLTFLNTKPIDFVLKMDLSLFYLNYCLLSPKFTEFDFRTLMQDVEFSLLNRCTIVPDEMKKNKIFLQKFLNLNFTLIKKILKFLTDLSGLYESYVGRKIKKGFKKKENGYDLDKKDKIEVVFYELKNTAKLILEKFMGVIEQRESLKWHVVGLGRLKVQFKSLINLILKHRFSAENLDQNASVFIDYANLDQAFVRILPMSGIKNSVISYKKKKIYGEIVNRRKFNIFNKKNEKFRYLQYQRNINSTPSVELRKLNLRDLSHYLRNFELESAKKYLFMQKKTQLFGLNDVIKVQSEVTYCKVTKEGFILLTLKNNSQVFLEKIKLKIEVKGLQLINDSLKEIDSFGAQTERRITFFFKNNSRGKKIVKIFTSIQDEEYLSSENIPHEINIAVDPDEAGVQNRRDNWLKSSFSILPLSLLSVLDLSHLRLNDVDELSKDCLTYVKKYFVFSDMKPKAIFDNFRRKFGCYPSLKFMRSNVITMVDNNPEAYDAFFEEYEDKKIEFQGLSLIAFLLDFEGKIVYFELSWVNKGGKSDQFLVENKFLIFFRF